MTAPGNLVDNVLAGFYRPLPNDRIRLHQTVSQGVPGNPIISQEDVVKGCIGPLVSLPKSD